MRKSILTLAAAILAFAVSAQISKGTILLGATSDASFISYDKDAGDVTQFSINLKGGYFFMDNLVGGLNLSYDKVDDYSAVGFGLFARYYFNGKIFLGAGYNSYNSKVDISGVEYETTTSTIPIEVGYAAFINNVVAVEPALNYTAYGSDAEGSSFGLSVGLTIYLGRSE